MLKKFIQNFFAPTFKDFTEHWLSTEYERHAMIRFLAAASLCGIEFEI